MMMALAMVEGSQKLPKNPRFLCLHGFRNSAKILQTSVQKWPQAVLQNLELVYLDAPYPAEGPSGVEGIFDPPYYEWFQANQDYTEYKNFEECIAYIEDYMVKNGPFDGILGFSQGAILASVLPGIQAQGLVLTKVPKIKFLIIISGAKFGGKKLGMPPLAAEAYSPPTQCLSLQFIGETDVLYSEGVDLFDCFVEPTVIHHPEGHTVPKLDEESLATTLRFIEKITRDCTALVNSADDGCNSARMKLIMAMAEGNQILPRKPRILCLHSFRTSAKILQILLLQKWPQVVLQKLEMVFLDAPYSAEGPSDVQGIFDPPYYEWFQANQDYTEYWNFEDCIAYIEKYMVKNGPFDGFLGFSQGATLAAALSGIQVQGLALTKVPKIKLLILISAGKFGGKKFGVAPLTAKAYSPPIQCHSLHFIGKRDFLHSEGVNLLNCFVDPIVIHHPKGHTIPRLDEQSLATMLRFIEKHLQGSVNSAENGCKLSSLL